MGKGEWEGWRGAVHGRQQLEPLDEEQRQGCRGQSGGAFVWSPAADVLETRDAIIVQVELPGVDEGQVLVEIVDGDLVVRGERPCPRPDQADGEEPDSLYRLVERAHGRFARRFGLPAHADAARATARLASGLLCVTIPKTSARAPRRFRVHIG